MAPPQDAERSTPSSDRDGSSGAGVTSTARHPERKHRAYLHVVALATGLLAVLTVFDRFQTPYWGVAYPLLAVYGIALFVLIWRRRWSSALVEVLLLGPLVLSLFGFLVVWRIAPAAVDTGPIELLLVMLWAGIAFPLSFLTFGTRRGLQVSGGIYVVFLLLVLPPAFRGDLPAASSLAVSRYTLSLAVFFAVMIALLWSLASRLEDVAAARAEAQLYAARAATDGLTGLANRRQLDDELDRQVARSRRHGEPLSLVLVDVDSFKAVNDRFGHAVGDRVLVDLAHRIAGSVRTDDVAGRWGGEEFLIIAPSTAQPAALRLAERCRSAVAATPFEEVGTISASFGVATSEDGEDARALLRRADIALYTAKDRGRDRVVGQDLRTASGTGPNRSRS